MCPRLSLPDFSIILCSSVGLGCDWRDIYQDGVRESFGWRVLDKDTNSSQSHGIYSKWEFSTRNRGYCYLAPTQTASRPLVSRDIEVLGYLSLLGREEQPAHTSREEDSAPTSTTW